jgi:hypothetical protein
MYFSPAVRKKFSLSAVAFSMAIPTFPSLSSEFTVCSRYYIRLTMPNHELLLFYTVPPVGMKLAWQGSLNVLPTNANYSFRRIIIISALQNTNNEYEVQLS